MSITEHRLNFRPFKYPVAYEFAKTQGKIHWSHTSIEIGSDLTQYHTEFTEAERHGINTVLQLFTLYETEGAANYWLDVVYKRFPVPEVRLMAQVFAGVEAEHALFYDKLNDALGLSTKEFYLSFLDNPYMKKRVSDIGKYLKMGQSGPHDDLAKSLAAFSFVEGVTLYSSFAFLMSFTEPPKNKLKEIISGIYYSCNDEAIHADGDSWLFNTLVKEKGIDREVLKADVFAMATASYELEAGIIMSIFSKGKISGITEKQLQNFVQSRINRKLKDIGYDPIYDVTYNPIEKWFYKKIKAIKVVDFFSTSSTEYHKDWNFGVIKEW